MLKRYPGEVNVHLQIGRAAAISGEQLDRGERELETWLASPPRDALVLTISNVHWRLGMIHEKQGRKDIARGDYNAALSINPSNENAKKSLAALK